VEVPADDVAQAVAPHRPEEWTDLGLLEPSGDGFRARVQIRCYQDLLIASDFGRDRGGQLLSDFVMAISPSTLALAGFTIRRPVGAALDLGSGAGLHAFLAAAHSRQVVGVDRNPRAVAMARLNALLNQLERVEFEEGDLFDPVKGQRFGLIVSNPPFVIAPALRYYFLHSGLPGDKISRRIVRTAPQFLEEGGFCQLAANWVVPPGEAWTDPLRRWVEGTGCDAFVLSKGAEDAGAYAAEWAQPVDEDPESLAASVEEALASFEAAGISAIASGLVTLRRRSGTNWFHADELPDSMAFPCGDDVLRVFEVQDALAGLGDERDLLACRLRLAPDVSLVQQCEPRDGSWSPVALEIHRTEGLRWSGSIDPSGAGLMARADGEVTLGQLLVELADSAGVDVDTVVAASLPIVRRLLEQGFLRADVSDAVPRSWR
jgi:SAM-dependent methyltransferase